MALPIVLLVVWAVVTVPMALVVLMDDGKRRPMPRKAPVIAIGARPEGDPHRHLSDAA